MNTLQKERITNMRADGMAYSTIAEELGLSRNTVKSFCQRMYCTQDCNKSSLQTLRKKCEMCGKGISKMVGHKKRRFCSDACRTAWWNSHRELIQGKAVFQYTCLLCGKTFNGYEKQHRKYCSHDCYIAHRYKLEREQDD